MPYPNDESSESILPRDVRLRENLDNPEQSIRTQLENLSEEERTRLEEALLARIHAGGQATNTISPRTDGGPWPLSPAQSRLWFLTQYQPESPAYHMGGAYRLRGTLDVCMLRASFTEIIRRHESLRTTFRIVGGVPMQEVQPPVEIPFQFSDLSAISSADQKDAISAAMRSVQRRPFDLTADLMLRVLVLRVADDEHVLVYILHHIAADGWSIGMLWQELAAIYAAYVHGLPSPLSELPIQYADFAVWQRERLTGPGQQKSLDFWLKQCTDLPTLVLPTDRPRPQHLSSNGARFRFRISGELSGALQQLSHREDATLFMTLLTVYEVLLARYTGQQDFAIGVPTAGRTQTEIEPLIGFFVNTLVIRTQMEYDLTFRSLLARVRQQLMHAFNHQEVPFERLVADLRPERRLNHQPLVQTVFQLNMMQSDFRKLHDLTVEPVRINHNQVRFDLECHLTLDGEQLSGVFVYNSDLFDPDRIERLATHFENLLTQIVAEPNMPIARLSLLTTGERRQLLSEWNGTATHYPRDATVQSLFEAQVLSTPDACAFQLSELQISYKELDRRANRLASALHARGIRPGNTVALCLERSAAYIVAMIAVLKAGCVYVPLDPAFPTARLAFILADTRASAWLTSEDFAAQHRELNIQPLHLDVDGSIAPVDGPLPGVAEDTEVEQAVWPAADAPAYIMYTSGSTGTPKGVVIPHRAITRLVRNTNYIDFQSSDRVALASNPAFDASTFEVWGALLNGATLVPIAREQLLAPHVLANVIHNEAISIMFLTTALFNRVAMVAPDAFATLHSLIVGGEAADADAMRAALESGSPKRLINAYGPTENTTFSAWQLVESVAPDATTIPIGGPLSNTQLYVLDSCMEPVPIGVPGELHIGGDGLAIEYLNQPALTKERFVQHPFSDDASARLYKTGDYVCWSADGALHFLGRRDNQIKIRGFRIELGEVEAVLNRHPGVKSSLVIARDYAPDDTRLAAYFTSAKKSAPPENTEVLGYLRDYLPTYMLPATIIPLDHFPLTPSGKIDRGALPAPTPRQSRLSSVASNGALRSDTEAMLAEVWCDLLQIDNVGAHDNFFELGGHSLLGIRLFAQLEKSLDRRLQIALLFQAPTIAELAAELDRTDDATSKAVKAGSFEEVVVPIQPRGSRSPFFCVHGFGGGVLGYGDLARLMGADQPFYGLQAIGLDGKEKPDETVQAMATRYIEAMRTVKPRGPYQIGGYCFGGVVAYEMAIQLRAVGADVSLVAIMEGYAPARLQRRIGAVHPRRLLAIWRNVPYWFQDYWDLGYDRLRQRWRRKMEQKSRAGHVLTPQDMVDDDLSDVPEHHLKLMTLHINALRTYEPAPYAGEITVFRANGQTISKTLFGALDPTLGWGDLATNVQVEPVAGGHRNIHMQPHVASLAKELQRTLIQHSG